MGQLVYYCAGADPNCLPAQNINAMLLNALDHGANDRKIKAAKQMCLSANSNHIMQDSSGYQILKAEEKGKLMTFDPNQPMKNTAKFLNLSTKHVMQVAAIHKPDIVIGLDFPIRKLKGELQMQLEFLNKLPTNIQWAQESFAWKNALIPEAQYFQPIQCNNLEHLDIFFNKIRGVNFDGVSMPIRNLKLADLALFLVSFYQRGIRKVHLLGTSSFLVIAMCTYLAGQMFEWVSLDSTTWRLAADKEEFLNLGDLSRRKLKTGIHIPDGEINDCPCPFCRGQGFTAIQALLPRKDKVDLLRRHNWWAIDNLVADMWANNTDLIQLERALKARSWNHRRVDDLIRILSTLILLKDDDITMLQSVLAPVLKSRKQSHSFRLSSSSVSHLRKPAKTSRQPTDTDCRSILSSEPPNKTEQIIKV